MAKTLFGAIYRFRLCELSVSSIVMERNSAVFIVFREALKWFTASFSYLSLISTKWESFL